MNDFNQFMNMYPIGESLVNSSTDYYILLKKIANQINKQYKEKYSVKFSCGQGRLSKVPWICIFNTSVAERAEKGLYVCILFKSDMSGFYIELGNGMQYFKDKFGSDSLKYLQKISSYFRNKILENNSYLDHIDLVVSRGTRGEAYEFGTVIAKYYEKNNFDIAVFKKDLDDILLIYDELVDDMSTTSYDEIINIVINDSNISLESIDESNQEEEQKELQELVSNLETEIFLEEVSIPKRRKRLTSAIIIPERKIDGIKNAKKNAEIGLIGEELVVEYEKQKMRDNKRPDLASKVIRESRVNDILGYDIRSYDFDENGKEYEIFIEVKSTESNEKNAFFISFNEYDKMQKNKEKYWIYRVSNKKHKFYKINYELLHKNFDIEPNDFIIKLKDK